MDEHEEQLSELSSFKWIYVKNCSIQCKRFCVSLEPILGIYFKRFCVSLEPILGIYLPICFHRFF